MGQRRVSELRPTARPQILHENSLLISQEPFLAMPYPASRTFLFLQIGAMGTVAGPFLGNNCSLPSSLQQWELRVGSTPLFLVYYFFSFCAHASVCAPALADRVKGQCQVPFLMCLHLVRQGSSLKLELAESARLTGQRVPRTQSLCLPAGIVAVNYLLLGTKLRSSRLCDFTEWATSPGLVNFSLISVTLSLSHMLLVHMCDAPMWESLSIPLQNSGHHF